MINMVENKKVAVITGITGQDGSYLAEFLLDKGYIVYGVVRRASTFNRERIEHLYTDHENKDNLKLLYGDLTDITSIISVLSEAQPDEIYNLAAQSHVQVSYETPVYTAQVDGVGVLNVLEAVRILGLDTKIYQASTSELYSGDPAEAPQDENTPFRPKSPYGDAKLYANSITKTYRDSYKMFICNGILFNHESERRGENFVTRKITRGLADMATGKASHIVLGDIDTKRDWGHAEDYVEAMWLMLQQDTPDDYVVATGETHTVREFIDEAFDVMKGISGFDFDKEKSIKFDKRFIRPNEVRHLEGNPTKIKEKLGWKPKVDFKELVKRMTTYDYENSSK
jgi:GDPmannose 4,6-dehydratase